MYQWNLHAVLVVLYENRAFEQNRKEAYLMVPTDPLP